MKSSTLLTLFLTAASILAVAHYIAVTYSLYFLVSWFDIPMHMLGGAVVVLFLFNTQWLRITLPNRWHRITPMLLCVLIVGLVWELFEIAIGIPLIEPDFEIDMWGDLLNDLIGGAIGWFVARRVSMLEL